MINRLLGLPHGEDALMDYLEILGEAVKADACTTLLLDPTAGTTRILGGIGLHTPVEEWHEQFKSPFFTEQVIGFPDVPALDPAGPFEGDPFLVREETASLLLKPAAVDGTYLVTTVLRRKAGTFMPDEVERFAAVSGVVNTLLLVHLILKEQSTSTGIDDLTGLGLFSDFHQSMVKEISRARRGSGTVTMGIMSIASLEPHLMKDAISDIARSFQRQLRDFDTLDRYGSNELAFILPDLECSEGVQVVERVIRETISSLGGRVQVPDIYVGLSCYPEDGATVERLIEMAEAAMNKALEESRPGVYRWVENGEQ